MRATALHVLPSVDELITMSFDTQFLRKRQSDHTTKTLPAPSMPTEGKFGLRIPPPSRWLLMLAMAWLLPQLVPPLVELKHRCRRLQTERSPCHSAAPRAHRPVRPHDPTKPAPAPKSGRHRSKRSSARRRCRKPDPTRCSNYRNKDWLGVLSQTLQFLSSRCVLSMMIGLPHVQTIRQIG